MSLRRREQLVRVAREYDALIITHDVYDMLQWPTASEAPSGWLTQAYLPRVVDVNRYLDGGPRDEFGNVVSNASFSKIVGPGCRTGWAEGTEKMAFGLSQTYAPTTNLRQCTADHPSAARLVLVDVPRNWWRPVRNR